MGECGLLILLAMALVCRTMAARAEVEHEYRLTRRKCCSASGDIVLGSKAATHSKFSDQICVQGSASTNSMFSDCRKKTYAFSGFAIKFTAVKTLEQTACPQSTSLCHDESTWQSHRVASERESCSNTIERRSNADDCDKRPTVAIFADYDGCWDIISLTNPRSKESWFNANTPSKPYKDVVYPLRKKIEEITAGKRVLLFVGSNRQSYEDDRFNAQQGNGRAIGPNNAFERWVQAFGALKNQCWELNKALLSDGNQPCSSWFEWRPSPWATWSQEKTKTKLLENGMKQLLPEDHVDLYFFDDHAEYLDYVRLHAKIPRNVSLYTVHYDWFERAEGKTTQPLQAIAA